MIKKLLLSTLVVFATFSGVLAQVGSGALQGTVVDSKTGEPLPFVNIVIELNGRQAGGTATDFDGKFQFKPINPGKYNVKASFTGYKPIIVPGVLVNAEKTQFVQLKLDPTIVDIEEFEIIEYTVPLIDKDNTVQGGTVTRDDIKNMAARDAASVAETVGGVYTKDDGNQNLNIRGSRDDANYYFIDGIKVRGTNNLPKASIEQVSVLTGGVPAQYGDITGGIVSITTRGASREYFGSIEYLTSGYKIGEKVVGLDKFGYNLLEFAAAGPLISKRDTSSTDSIKKRGEPIVGFFLSGNYTSEAEPRPSPIGFWQIKDDALANIKENPLRINTGPAGGTFQEASFLRMSDFEKVQYRQNVARRGMVLSGKIDINTSKNTNLTIGGQFDYRMANRSNFSFSSSNSGGLYSYSAMNYENNPLRTELTYRVFTRFTHRFGAAESGTTTNDEEKSASIIKNAYYTIQADYSKYILTDQNEQHKKNYFDYGYVGKFERFQTREYTVGTDSLTGLTGLIQTTFTDTLIGFTPGDRNKEMSTYTEKYYELFGWQGYDENGVPAFDKEKADDPTTATNNDYLRNFVNIQSFGGLINGTQPRDVYDMWRAPGYQFNLYDQYDNSQLRFQASGSADIKGHGLLIGFEYEQRVDRRYALSPSGLWQLGRQLTNNHIENLDLNNPIIQSFATYPTISYDRLNSAPDALYGGSFSGQDPQAFFDYNLRGKLGLNPDGNDFINFDNIDPNDLSINYFSADELLNNGNAYVTYYGYDHHGNKIRRDASFDEFFTAQDEYGNYVRSIGAFRPIYVAGYIQDKFTFDDLVFNIGLRIDRYDANQKVLKDPYVLFPTVAAGEDEAQALLGEGKTLPSNIGSDYIVYVDNITKPTSILGYRNGSRWYNAEGAEIDDPKILATSSGNAAPLLVDKNNTQGKDITSSSFEDYKPQTNFMPRIAFSFPISESAGFFAHYDILTKRPTSGQRLDPTDYFFLEQNSGNPINNPNLKPEKTIDYEIGFQQTLSKTSALKISAFYRELRDMVQVVNVYQAYPRTYSTYGNIDFGTVKGLTVGYDLRRTGNVMLRAAYTLQFADGTGSSSTTASNLIRQGKANLRVTNPLEFDQRHTLTATLDYRYGSLGDYNGPVILGYQVLAKTGANFVFNAGSGTPYSALKVVRSEGLFSQGTAILDGSINGSRLPWQFRIDMKVDRDISLKLGKDKGAKTLDMNVYIQINNLLNAMNVTTVYRATGNANDDGYLTAAQFQNEISAAVNMQSYRELYTMKINNPGYYNLPRRFRLGLLVSI